MSADHYTTEEKPVNSTSDRLCTQNGHVYSERKKKRNQMQPDYKFAAICVTMIIYLTTWLQDGYDYSRVLVIGRNCLKISVIKSPSFYNDACFEETPIAFTNSKDI